MERRIPRVIHLYFLCLCFLQLQENIYFLIYKKYYIKYQDLRLG